MEKDQVPMEVRKDMSRGLFIEIPLINQKQVKITETTFDLIKKI